MRKIEMTYFPSIRVVAKYTLLQNIWHHKIHKNNTNPIKTVPLHYLMNYSSSYMFHTKNNRLIGFDKKNSWHERLGDRVLGSAVGQRLGSWLGVWVGSWAVGCSNRCLGDGYSELAVEQRSSPGRWPSNVGEVAWRHRGGGFGSVAIGWRPGRSSFSLASGSGWHICGSSAQAAWSVLR
jgi:hypothetical protein